MKTCTQCQEEKDESCFYKAKAYKGGLKSRCKTCVLISNKNYAQKNRAKVTEYLRFYKNNNREAVNTKNRAWLRKTQYFTTRYKTDIQFKLRHVLRTRLNKFIRGKSSPVNLDILGCSIEELKKYLESKFQPGMTWENWSTAGWHIDHIQPLVNFDLTNPEHVKIACRYTNLQPLWAEDNFKKSDN